MAFQKGNKLAVGGRRDKPWRDALQIALKDREDGQALRKIADKCVEAALNGDKDARREIADRLDGKPMQETEVTSRRVSITEMSDDELERIARGGEGTAAPEDGAAGSDSVH